MKKIIYLLFFFTSCSSALNGGNGASTRNNHSSASPAHQPNKRHKKNHNATPDNPSPSNIKYVPSRPTGYRK